MIHRYKMMAVCDAKLKAILSNINIMVGPLLAIFFTLIMRFVYGKIADGTPSTALLAMVLNMGVLFNISMTGMFTTSLCLAEEKEKHTLRTLMTSSVNGTEFFLGSIIPPMFIMVIVNIIVLFVSGLPLNAVHIPSYFISTTAAGIISCILGMVFGIYAKSQTSASTLTTPAMLIIMMVPMFGNAVPALAKLSGYIFTGAVTDMISQWGTHAQKALGIKSILVLAIEFVLISAVFLLIYKRNGFEKE